MYQSYDELPFTSDNLFEALHLAIRESFEESIGDPQAFDAIRAQLHEMSADVVEIMDCIKAIEKCTLLSTDDLNVYRQKVAKQIENDTKHINVETTQGAKKVAISKLVIQARLNDLSSSGEIPLPHRETWDRKKQTVSFLSFRRSFKNALVLGDPGGGKTTLTQFLCNVMSKQVLLGVDVRSYEKLDARDFQIPLRIILRTYEKRKNINPSYSFYDYLADEIKASCDNDLEIARAFLNQTLHLGGAIVIFDGLDEILDVGARRDIASSIESFSSSFASCPTLVTSRIVGYNDAPLSDIFQIFTLARFNNDEVKTFSEKLLSVVAQVKKPQAVESARNFVSQTEEVAADLRENPLLLGLMVYIFNSWRDVPNNRPEIYKECSLLMFEKWDQRRDIKFKFPHYFDLLDLFGYLASKIFGNAETEDGVSSNWLRRHLRDFFFDWYEDRARSEEASLVLREFITGRAWVMCEVGPGVYKFTHRTFLEYFLLDALKKGQMVSRHLSRTD